MKIQYELVFANNNNKNILLLLSINIISNIKLIFFAVISL